MKKRAEILQYVHVPCHTPGIRRVLPPLRKKIMHRLTSFFVLSRHKGRSRSIQGWSSRPVGRPSFTFARSPPAVPFCSPQTKNKAIEPMTTRGYCCITGHWQHAIHINSKENTGLRAQADNHNAPDAILFLRSTDRSIHLPLRKLQVPNSTPDDGWGLFRQFSSRRVSHSSGGIENRYKLENPRRLINSTRSKMKQSRTPLARGGNKMGKIHNTKMSRQGEAGKRTRLRPNQSDRENTINRRAYAVPQQPPPGSTQQHMAQKYAQPCLVDGIKNRFYIDTAGLGLLGLSRAAIDRSIDVGHG